MWIFGIKLYQKSLLRMVKCLKMCKKQWISWISHNPILKSFRSHRFELKIAVLEYFPDPFSLSTNGDLVLRMFKKRDRLAVLKVVPKYFSKAKSRVNLSKMNQFQWIWWIVHLHNPILKKECFTYSSWLYFLASWNLFVICCSVSIIEK